MDLGERVGGVEDRLALERRDAQLGRRAPQERGDEQQLVEPVEKRAVAGIRGAPGCGQAGLDLERRAAAGRQRPLRRDDAAGDEVGADVPRLGGGHEHAARQRAQRATRSSSRQTRSSASIRSRRRAASS